jgi:hypothetical protein
VHIRTYAFDPIHGTETVSSSIVRGFIYNFVDLYTSITSDDSGILNTDIYQSILVIDFFLLQLFPSVISVRNVHCFQGITLCCIKCSRHILPFAYNPPLSPVCHKPQCRCPRSYGAGKPAWFHHKVNIDIMVFYFLKVLGKEEITFRFQKRQSDYLYRNICFRREVWQT